MTSQQLRPFLIVSIIVMTVLCGYAYHKRIAEVPKLIVIGDVNPLEEIKPTPIIPPILKEIDEKNESIKSFSCDSIIVRTWERGFSYKLSGFLGYEKPDRFRMIFSSVFGKELDIGSNEELFWYWSRRDVRPGIYWAKNEDLYKTRLKTPFNPLFFRSSLGLDKIEPDKAIKIIPRDKAFLVVYQIKSATGEEVLYSKLVDTESKRIEGTVITSTSGKPIASCEIRRFAANNLPVEILYTWHEENRTVLLSLNSPIVNTQIDARSWQIPNYTPKINMADEY